MSEEIQASSLYGENHKELEINIVDTGEGVKDFSKMTPFEFYEFMSGEDPNFPGLKEYQRMILDNCNRIVGPNTHLKRMVDPSVDENVPRHFVNSDEGIELLPLPQGTGKTSFMTEILTRAALEEGDIITHYEFDDFKMRLSEAVKEMEDDENAHRHIIIDSLAGFYGRGSKTGPFLKEAQQAFSMHPAPPKELPLTRTEKRKQQRKRAKEKAREMKTLRKEFVKEAAKNFPTMETIDSRPVTEVSSVWKREVIPGGENIEHPATKSL